MMNVGNPELAFDFAQIPNAGVGLARWDSSSTTHRRASEGDPRLSEQVPASQAR